MPRKQKPQTKTTDLAQQQPAEVRIVMNQMQEHGSSGLREAGGFVSEAYNAQLYYPQVYPTYNKIRRATPEIVTIRRAFTAWAANVSPQVDLPDKPTDDDKRYRDFIEADFDNMEGGFGTFIDTAVNHVPFTGFGWWDVAPALRDPNWAPPPYADSKGQTWQDEWRSEADDGLIGIRRIGWRDVSSFAGWEFDGRKKVIGMKQQDHPNPPVLLKKDHSLHMTFGDPNNPEGLSPLEAVWRLERLKYGYEVVMGIGSEHAAGHLKVNKTQQGSLSNSDKQIARQAARAILTAQEGNYAVYPYGMDGNVIDIPFQAAGNLLETIKFYSITMLSVYMMQFVALNTMTNTGAQASQVDSTQIGIFSFNAMLDGFAAQYNEQIGKRLYRWNKASFPNLTKRPMIKFSHIENNLAMGELGSFLQALNGIIPLGEEDAKALRKRSGWMPENNPKPGEELKTKPAAPQPGQGDPAMNGEGMPMDEATGRQASQTKGTLEQSLKFVSRSQRGG